MPSQVQLQELAAWQNKIPTEQQRQGIAINRAKATARRAARKADKPGPKAKATFAAPEKQEKAAPKRNGPESGSETENEEERGVTGLESKGEKNTEEGGAAGRL